MSNETTPPIRLSDQTKIRLPLAMLIGLIGIAATAAVIWSGDHRIVQELPAQVGAIETRVRKLEDSQTEIAVMKNDVRWIRQAIAEQQTRRPGSNP
jgi:hypothetical protein